MTAVEFKEPIKAFAYVRVSGKGQVDGDGFPRQREKIGYNIKLDANDKPELVDGKPVITMIPTGFSAMNGYVVVDEFREEGVSGTKETLDRPALADCLSVIAGNGVRTIIVEDSSRLARDLMISELIIAECRKLGVKVIDSRTGQDLVVDDGDPTRILIRQVLAAISQWEKSSIVLKLRAARSRAKRQNGRCEGQKPFGHYPVEHDTLIEILEMDQLGFTTHLIASWLNKNKRSTRKHWMTGKPSKWDTSTLWAILKREKSKPSGHVLKPSRAKYPMEKLAPSSVVSSGGSTPSLDSTPSSLVQAARSLDSASSSILFGLSRCSVSGLMR